MPRGKNKKFSIRQKKTEKTKEVNPFELKVNRQKHEVLGRKLSRTDKGMPGVSRSKAIKKVCFTSCICSTVQCAYCVPFIMLLPGLANLNQGDLNQ